MCSRSTRGDQGHAASLQEGLERALGGNLRGVVVGSAEADALKQRLIVEEMWLQYLEVAIEPDAEIFTNPPVLSTVGWGAAVGFQSDPTRNNPEPEIAFGAGPEGHAIGVTLTDDVNLRDFEGRSVPLPGKAKDSNASCSLGPLIRLLSDSFIMDDIGTAESAMTIERADGYRLDGASTIHKISRHPKELLRQVISEHHYPNGLVLFGGTLSRQRRTATRQDAALPPRSAM